MADDLREFASRLDRLAKDLSGPQMKQVMTSLGVDAKKDIVTAVDRDIGGSTFSRWPRASLVGGFEHVGDGSISIEPQRRSRGPMRVAEQGRRAGMSNGRRRKGRVGATRGRGTWTDAGALIEKNTLVRAEREIHKLISKSLGF